MVSEDQLEQLCLDWFRDQGFIYAYGPDIAHDGDTPERSDYLQVVLPGRLLRALEKINLHIPLATLEEAAQADTKTESPVLIHSNRAFCKRLSGELAPSAAEAETADAI
jgi:type I restriction enzyme R subunit